MTTTSHLIAPDALFSVIVPENEVNSRIDVFITKQFPHYSRSFFKRLIDDNLILLNGKMVHKPSIPLKVSDTITIQFPPKAEAKSKDSVPQEMGVKIIYEHADFFIITKPSHLLVHAPSSYSTELTLVDWLMAYCPEIVGVGTSGRPGIVHRLDKGTSGLMIIARNQISHTLFADMFRDRTIKKTYIAVVDGHPDKNGTVDFPIARDPHVKTKMTHRNSSGRHATTNFNVLEYFENSSLLELKPITGRTHQLRVHCAALGYPIIGDTQYGTPHKLIERQALHAQSLSFTYQGTEYSFTQEPPEDFNNVLGSMKLAQKLPLDFSKK